MCQQQSQVGDGHHLCLEPHTKGHVGIYCGDTLRGAQQHSADISADPSQPASVLFLLVPRASQSCITTLVDYRQLEKAGPTWREVLYADIPSLLLLLTITNSSSRLMWSARALDPDAAAAAAAVCCAIACAAAAMCCRCLACLLTVRFWWQPSNASMISPVLGNLLHGHETTSKPSCSAAAHHPRPHAMKCNTATCGHRSERGSRVHAPPENPRFGHQPQHS